MQWSHVLADQALQNLAYKIELNRQGKIEMSPATNKHGFLQSEIAFLLRQHLTHGRVITECAIQTAQGVKVADVAWGSLDFFRRQPLAQDPFQHAPEICVEIVSPANSRQEMQEKRQLYIAQGAEEVWLLDLQGNCRFFNRDGEQCDSAFKLASNVWQNLKEQP
jgi:Uma2 family endonuclease